MAQAMELSRTAAQSCKQEAISRHQSLSAFRIEICFTILADDAPANELGGHVRKGEESTVVVFWKIEDSNQSGNNAESDESNGRRFLLRYYRVFNLEQCELFQAVLDKLPKVETREHAPIAECAEIVGCMPNAPEIQHGGSKAFYSALTDRVTLPPPELFTSDEEYYATGFHELIHYADFRIMLLYLNKSRQRVHDLHGMRHNSKAWGSQIRPISLAL